MQQRVRSFKRRRGRMSAAKLQALATLGPRWRIDTSLGPAALAPFCVAGSGLLDQSALFGRSGAELVLDVGFGAGGSTEALATAHPELDVLAVDVHTAGVANLLRRIERAELTNVRIVEGDVWDVLDRLGPASLGRLQVFFPDPWPKARHHGRRLVQRAFVAAVTDRLQPGGVLHVATDWADYATAARTVLAREARLVVTVDQTAVGHPAAGASERPSGRPPTTYEDRAQAAGRPITDLVAVRS